MGKVLTGSRGAIYIDPASGDDVLVLECAGWEADFSANGKQFGSCSAGSYMNATTGRKGATGTIKGYLDDETELNSILEEGDEVILLLYFDNENDRCHRVPAVVSNVKEVVNIADDSLTEWTANWMSKGAYEKNLTRAVVAGS